MKNLLVLCLFVFLVVSPVLSEEEHDDENSNVVTLSEANFDQTLADNEYVFVDFYAPWCGHCKTLVPVYEKVAAQLKEEGSKIVIAKVDATQNEALATKYQVRGYPTLKLFRSGTPIDFDSGRGQAEIVGWLLKKTGPPSVLINTIEQLEAFLKKTGSKVVAFLTGDKDDTEEYKHWVNTAQSGKVDDFLVAHVTDKSLFGEHKAPSFHLHKDGEDQISYSGDFDHTNILKFIESEGYPLIEDLTQKVWTRSSNSKLPLVCVFVPSTSTHQDVIDYARDVAKKFKGKAIFSFSQTPNFAERWGASGKVIPTSVMVRWGADSEPSMIVFDEENEKFGADTLESFVVRGMEGTYKSYKKSEPVPEDNSGPVKILVGKTFEDIVYDNSKDVFVEFYAPWCGHCKKLSPIWEELGETFEDNKDIVIAKMDATLNAAPESIEIKGYPTLVFFPADDKTGLAYNGERDLESLVQFVHDKASHTVGKEEL